MSGAYPPGVEEFLDANPGAHAGEVAGRWYCRFPVDARRTVSAPPCEAGGVLDVLDVLEGLREAARQAVQKELPGWRLTARKDGTWLAAGPSRARFGAAGIVRLRALIGGGEQPTEAEAAMAGQVPA
jgi:hypothetical protein